MELPAGEDMVNVVTRGMPLTILFLFYYYLQGVEAYPFNYDWCSILENRWCLIAMWLPPVHDCGVSYPNQ